VRLLVCRLAKTQHLADLGFLLIFELWLATSESASVFARSTCRFAGQGSRGKRDQLDNGRKCAEFSDEKAPVHAAGDGHAERLHHAGGRQFGFGSGRPLPTSEDE
jgi:hypothetical protein